MWKLEIVNHEGLVAEHEDVGVKARSLNMRGDGEPFTVLGFTAYGADGTAIESIGGESDPFKLTDEGLVCIKGVWTHFDSPDFRFGIRSEDGGFTAMEDLELGQHDPRLSRTWTVSFDMNGQELLDRGRAPGYAGTD